MTWKNTADRWGPVSQLLHWLIVILILGHLIVPIAIEVNLTFNMAMWAQMLFWPALTALLGLLMIQPAKGAVIAFQWSRRMHGFEKG